MPDILAVALVVVVALLALFVVVPVVVLLLGGTRRDALDAVRDLLHALHRRR